MISALRLFLRAYWKPLAVVVAVLLALGGSFWAGHVWTDRGWQVKESARLAAESSQVAAGEHAARIIEQGRDIAREEAVKHANEQAAQARADSAAAGAALDRLLARAKAAEGRNAAASATAALGSAAGEKTARMYADLLKGTGALARRYADIADDAITRGETCERIYDSVASKQ